MRTGIVYKVFCTVTQKYYIGITIQKFQKRKYDHENDSFNVNSDHYNQHFHRAIRKYGKDSFEWEIICVIKSENKEKLIEQLKALEIHYVNKYDSYHNGYNSTKGGDEMTTNSKPVDVYSEDGELIASFDSRLDVSLYYGISQDCVCAVCLGKQKFSFIDNKRYIFRDKGVPYTEEQISEIKSIKHNPKRMVEAYYYDTNEVIKQFNTIKEASQYFKITPSGISEVVNGNKRRKTAGKYNGRKLGWREIK